MERREETKKVKDALRNAGINAVVGHGKGTAWGWLYINVGSGEQYGEHIEGENRSHYRCPRCTKIRAITERAERIAQDVTGRSGEYGGKINIYTQKDWTKKGEVEIIQSIEDVEIIQPN